MLAIPRSLAVFRGQLAWLGREWQTWPSLLLLAALAPWGHESTMARGKACRPCPALSALPSATPLCPLEPWPQSPDRGGLGGPMVGAQRHGHQRERWDAVRQAWEATVGG
jgi:hypothetical protein